MSQDILCPSMSEILPCPKNPALLCVPGVCGNNIAINAIQRALDEATVPLIHQAQEQGIKTEYEVTVYVKNDPDYQRAATTAIEALGKLDLAECAPIAYLPSAS